MGIQAEAIEYAGVRLDGDRLVEHHRGVDAMTVGRGEAARIRLHHGFVAPHPIVQFVFGAALVLLGCAPIVAFIRWAIHGGVIAPNVLWASVFAVIGVPMVVRAFRRGHFLQIKTPAGERRLTFTRDANAPELRAFAAQLERAWGLAVESEV